jgi:predicted small secreted protein
MMKKKTRLFNLLIILAVFLSACNLPSSDVEDIASTAAAQTVEALLSATPISGAVTPSFTPLPIPATLTPIPLPISTNTPAATATTNCNTAQFITDVTVPDGTLMTPSQAFTKKWRIKNIGSCAWTGFSLVFDSGDSMGGPATKAISVINPGQEVDLEVNLTAPAAVGTYRGYWRINTNGGILVPVVNGNQGKSFYVDIKVQLPATVTNTAVPATATNTSAPAFTVSGVTFTNTGGCGAFTATANITTNGAGSVTYHWVRSDAAADVAHPAVVFASASTQSVNTTWTAALAPGTYWIDIYIDTPNNLQFGRSSFTCP